MSQVLVALAALSAALPQSILESGLTNVQLQQLAEAGVVSISPAIVSGAVVFAGTRVPVYNLWDYLSGGDSIDDFLESFPTVRREQAEQALRLTQEGKKEREHSL